MWVHILFQESDHNTAIAQMIVDKIILADDVGNLVAEITGVKLKHLKSGMLLENMAGNNQKKHTKLHTKHLPIENNQFLKKFFAVASANRQQMIEQYLIEIIANSLQLSVAKLDSQQPLSALIDSLVALEIINHVDKDLKIRIPMEKFLGNTSIAEIAELIFEQLTISALVDKSDNCDERIEEFYL